MRHVKIVALCLVAVFAVAAVVASSASAAGPEWGQCYKKEKGKYADANCQTKAAKGAGEYEFRKATAVAHKGFTGAGGAGLLLSDFYFCKGENWKIDEICHGKESEDNGKAQVECTSENATGEDSGKNGVKNVDVIFHGCSFGFVSCQNTTTEGEIKVNPLKGVLGYINKATKEVGVDLNPLKKKAPFAEFECAEGIDSLVVGQGPNKWESYLGKATEEPYYGSKGGGDGIISPITPVNQMTNSFTQVYTENANSENVPSHFEGKSVQLLENYLWNSQSPEHERSSWSPAAEVITNVNTPEEEAMIKA